jgi:ribosome-associated translation inhibitor RaiA
LLLCTYAGELKVLETGEDVYDSLDKAVDSLVRKLKKISKPAPQKKDQRRSF